MHIYYLIFKLSRTFFICGLQILPHLLCRLTGSEQVQFPDPNQYRYSYYCRVLLTLSFSCWYNCHHRLFSNAWGYGPFLNYFKISVVRVLVQRNWPAFLHEPFESHFQPSAAKSTWNSQFCAGLECPFQHLQILSFRYGFHQHFLSGCSPNYLLVFPCLPYIFMSPIAFGIATAG